MTDFLCVIGRSRIILSLLGIALLALLLRLWAIEDRPMHTDEAVHAVILGQMLQTGRYRYNPVDSHGPLLYYLTYPVLRVLGDHSLADLQAWQLRLIPATLGALTILSLLAWRGLVPGFSLVLGGLLLAISSPVVYYQRYFIHESLFALLTLVFLNLLCRLARSPRHLHWILCGLGATSALLLATKETAPLIFVAGFLSFAISYRKAVIAFIVNLRLVQFIAFCAPFAVIIVLFYSSFGTNWQGLADLFHAQFRFAHRAGGEGHQKPFWSYLLWLIAPSHFTAPYSSEFIMILAGISLLLKASRPIRFIGIYSLLTLVIYSAIPYKTPWLEMNILVPAILPACYACYRAWRKLRRPWIFAGLLGFALVLMGQETRLLCFKYPADDRNPLAYSPTVPDIDNLTVALARYPNSTTIYVISTDYWPLPWYLRRFQSVGYWDTVPDKVDASVVIVSPDLLPQVLAKMPGKPTVQFFGLRPEVLTLLIIDEPPHP